MNKYIEAVLALDENEQVETLKRLSFKRIDNLPEPSKADFTDLKSLLLIYEQDPTKRDSIDSWFSEVHKNALENKTCAYCGNNNKSELDHHCSYLCKAEWEEMYEGLKVAYNL